jgi:hypothetical protein
MTFIPQEHISHYSLFFGHGMFNGNKETQIPQKMNQRTNLALKQQTSLKTINSDSKHDIFKKNHGSKLQTLTQKVQAMFMLFTKAERVFKLNRRRKEKEKR